MNDDLSPDQLSATLPRRAVRAYPALLSTEADALAWARAGAPSGAVVVADYQASPRGRAGLEWEVRPGEDLAFSLILRPTRLETQKEGWLYPVACVALAGVMGPETTIEWPDALWRDQRRVASVGMQVKLGPGWLEWAVISVLIPNEQPPRGPLLRKAIEAIEAHAAALPPDVLADYLSRCRTIGRRVRARMIPMGPSGPQVVGRAVGTLLDGALLIETENGRRIGIKPQNLGILEDV